MYPYSRGFIPRSFLANQASNVIANTAKTIPFSPPKAASTLANVAKTGKSLSFSSLLNGAQKGINTLNQIIPLYNQVKPLIQNGKSMLNIFKNVKNTNFEPEGKESVNNDVIEVPKEELKEKELKKEENYVVFNQTQPSKPFFVC